MKRTIVLALVLLEASLLTGCIPYVISPPNSGPGSWGFGYTESHGGGIDPVTQAGIDQMNAESAAAANP